jgi:hypothetical protein
MIAAGGEHHVMPLFFQVISEIKALVCVTVFRNNSSLDGFVHVWCEQGCL